MNCTQCNAQLPEGTKFCPSCGCTAEAKTSGANRSRLVGILYALASLLLIFLPSIGSGIMGNTSIMLKRLMAGEYGTPTNTAAAFSVLLNVLSYIDYTVYSVAGLIMAVAALALLMNKKGAYKAALAGGIAGLAAVCYAFFMAIAMSVCPQLLVSVYVFEAETIETAVKIIRGEPAFIIRCIVAAFSTAALIIPSFIIMIKAKRNEPEGSALCQKMLRSTASLMTLLPLLSIALRLKNTVSTVYVSMLGTNAMVANSTADVVAAGIISVSAAMLLLITVYCVLMKKFRYPLFVFPGLGALALYGVVALVWGNSIKDELAYYYGLSEDLLEMASEAVIGKIIGALFLLIAIYFWIAATARGNMRAWGQIIFAVGFIFLAIILENMKVTVFALGIAFPLAEIVIGNAMLAAAIPLSIRNREKDSSAG